ncbi:MAG: bifunctional phosphoribosyl-AMP cyclohydrolase/phosphoribosyl-ATP diphosphatase HisIE [Cyanobacteriota bacterium]|nr:bifunctional phosphoribosyl-AMP cyclohydrolase/phosphoribosyl-ATP diphosphatase HisIE [Cyanobacteriota bacterium]
MADLNPGLGSIPSSAPSGSDVVGIPFPLSSDTLALLDRLAYDTQGLLPAIVQDYLDGAVLMLAWMSRQSLQKTLETGRTWFWSRSRQQLWPKGETSGHWQEVKAIRYDCDQDALLIMVEQKGDVACHTGSRSCFFRDLVGLPSTTLAPAFSVDPSSGDRDHPPPPPLADTLSQVFAVIQQRQAYPQANSYTNQLLDKGDNAILKKLGEETAEVVMAVKDRQPDAIAGEIADLWYHCLVALAYHHVDLKDVYRKLQARRTPR